MYKVYNILDKYFFSKNYIVFIIKSCIIFFIISLFLNAIIQDIFNFELGNNTTIETLNKYPIWVYFIVGGLVVPIFETILFQWLPIFIFTLIGSEKQLYELIFSISIALIFGMAHNYSIGYIISSFFIGFLYLCYGFFLQKRGKNFFIPIFIVHSFNNILSMSIGYINI